MKGPPGSSKSLRTIGWLLLALCFPAAGATLDPAVSFDAANKLYEQGRYAQAAAAYQAMIQSGPVPETVYFNLGNACFKADQMGRAIAAWRAAEKISPRDPSIRFNLNFARKRVTGSDVPTGAAWQRMLSALTLNEWSALAAVTVWLWFLLLAIREWRPDWRPALRGYTATAGIAVLLLTGCIVGAAHLQFDTRPAVVVAPQAIVRSGPLEEAKVLLQLRDGVELTVIDAKILSSEGQSQTWYEVRDDARHSGWVKSEQIALIQ